MYNLEDDEEKDTSIFIHEVYRREQLQKEHGMCLNIQIINKNYMDTRIIVM